MCQAAEIVEMEGLELNETDLKVIGERLRELRTSAKLTQGDLARGSGEHQSIISDVERGYRKPSVDLLIWIARRFQTTVDYLLFGGGRDRARGPVCDNNEPVTLFKCAPDDQGLLTCLEEVGNICIPSDFFTPSTIALQIQNKGNEPIVLPGAIVGIDQEDKAIMSGELYFFKLREGYTICRAFAGKEFLLLRKENTKHPEITLPIDRVNADSVVGRVKWVFQRL